MTQEELNKAVTDNPPGPEAAAQPTLPVQTEPQPGDTLGDYIPLLTQLRMTKKALTAVPTFVPRTFLEQLQFYNSALYFWIGGSWHALSCYARSYLANAQSINDISATKVLLDTNDLASGITWDGTNKRFVVTEAVRYFISAQAWYNQPVDAGFYKVMIYVNGAEVATGAQNSGSTLPVSPSVSFLANLSINDYVEIYTFHNSGGAKTVSAGSNLTYASIHKV